MSTRSPYPVEESVAGADWDRLAAEQFYSSTPWLDHCQLYPGVRLDRVSVADGGSSAGTCVTAYDSTRPGNYDWSAKYQAAQVQAPAPQALLVAPPMGYQAAILHKAGPETAAGDTHHEALITALLAQIRQAAQRLTGQQDCVAMYLSTGDVRLLRRAGVTATPLLLEPDAWIELPDGGWDGYLAGLPTHRRNTIRRERRRFEAAGCAITHHDLRDMYTELPPLAESMAIKYGYPGRAPGFLEEFGKYVQATGEHARVALCRHDGHLIGFCIYYVWGSSLYLRWASFDYARLTGNAEYLNLTYYAQVQVAENAGVRRLHAGKNALPAKVLRGARLRPMWALDVSDRDPVGADAALLRSANARTLQRLTDDPILAAAIDRPEDWTEFC